MSERPPCLEVRDLHVRYPDGAHAVRGVSLVVGQGETVALVGESGCGKTTIANAIIGGLPRRSTVEGEVHLAMDDGTTVDLLSLDARARRALRGRRIGYVPQNPFGACDPLRRVDHHVESSWRVHGLRPGDGEVVTLVERLGVQDAVSRLRARPHTWSGGMLQRASIAGGRALAPALVLADEPTSALDADLARSTLAALCDTGAAVLLISHDLMLAAAVATRVYVLYGGELMEEAAGDRLLDRPRHPYSRALLDAVPRARGVLPVGLDGSPPGARREPGGCAFATRCPVRLEACTTTTPTTINGVRCLRPEAR